MKRLSLYLFFIFFSFLTPSLSDDIQDFEIEGISIGDSLLNYMTKKKILSEIEDSKKMYARLGKQIFSEVYYLREEGNFENYDYLSFFVNPEDTQYIIHAIYAVKYYLTDIDKCYIQQKEIVVELENVFKNENKIEEANLNINWDSTGKSKLNRTIFKFKNGDVAAVECYDWDESMQTNETPNPDIISVSVNKKDVYNWIN